MASRSTGPVASAAIPTKLFVSANISSLRASFRMTDVGNIFKLPGGLQTRRRRLVDHPRMLALRYPIAIGIAHAAAMPADQSSIAIVGTNTGPPSDNPRIASMA